MRKILRPIVKESFREGDYLVEDELSYIVHEEEEV